MFKLKYKIVVFLSLLLTLMIFNGCVSTWKKEDPFLKAVRKGNYKKVKDTLLESPHLINKKSEGFSGETPLMKAVHYPNNVDIVNMLLSMGADVHAKDNSGYTVLHHVSVSYTEDEQNPEILRMLLEKGADVNVKSSSGTTPLHWAGHFCRSRRVIEMFIENKANMSAKNNFGETALHNAARSGNVTATETLVKKGADVNARNNTGDTPLHLAAAEAYNDNYEAVTRLLLAGGADVTTKNNKGLRPSELGSHYIVNTLIEDAVIKKEKDAWPSVLSEDTLEKYVQFLAKYPDGNHYKEAEKRARELKNIWSFKIDVEIEELVSLPSHGWALNPQRTRQGIEKRLEEILTEVLTQAGHRVDKENPDAMIKVVYREYMPKQEFLIITPRSRLIVDIIAQKQKNPQTFFHIVLPNLKNIIACQKIFIVFSTGEAAKVSTEFFLDYSGKEIMTELRSECFLFRKTNTRETKYYSDIAT